jgi:hypothetical protein
MHFTPSLRPQNPVTDRCAPRDDQALLQTLLFRDMSSLSPLEFTCSPRKLIISTRRLQILITKLAVSGVRDKGEVKPAWGCNIRGIPGGSVLHKGCQMKGTTRGSL